MLPPNLTTGAGAAGACASTKAAAMTALAIDNATTLAFTANLLARDD
jgi:hypothetical protein